MTTSPSIKNLDEEMPKLIEIAKLFDIQLEDKQYNFKVSNELLEIDENKVHFKIQLYFNKYITKYELSLHKISITQLVINAITNKNMRFNLKIED